MHLHNYELRAERERERDGKYQISVEAKLLSFMRHWQTAHCTCPAQWNRVGQWDRRTDRWRRQPACCLQSQSVTPIRKAAPWNKRRGVCVCVVCATCNTDAAGAGASVPDAWCLVPGALCLVRAWTLASVLISCWRCNIFLMKTNKRCRCSCRSSWTCCWSRRRQLSGSSSSNRRHKVRVINIIGLAQKAWPGLARPHTSLVEMCAGR